MTIDIDGAEHYEEPIVVEERTYDSTPIENTITLKAR